MDKTQVAQIAARLTDLDCQAIFVLPKPRDADPVRWKAARPYGSCWRKASGYWDQFLRMEEVGLVERRVSRGETLWRLSRPSGLAVRSYLESQTK